jgi:hypothetical protein
MSWRATARTYMVVLSEYLATASWSASGPGDIDANGCFMCDVGSEGCEELPQFADGSD